MYKWLLVAVTVLVLACCVTAQGSWGVNGTNYTLYNDTNMTMTDMDMDMTGVVICPKGYYGPPHCNETCAAMCGPGNDCDPVNGTCNCNSCWNGTNCQDAISSSCFEDYLATADKETALFQSFGGTIPEPELTRLRTYFSQSIDVRTAASFDLASFTLAVDERSDTNARPLAKVTFKLLYNSDPQGVLNSIAVMRDLVKRGNWRATLAIQNMPSTATNPEDFIITMNI